MFCNHEKSVVCELDKKSNIGTLRCKTCGQTFQSLINGLSQPVDIYSDWVDACEAVADEAELKGEDAFEEKDGYDEEDDEYSE